MRFEEAFDALWERGLPPDATYDEGKEKSRTGDNNRFKLAQLRTEGVVLRNEGCKQSFDWSEWILKLDDWEKRTRSAISERDPSDAEWWRTLDSVPEPRVHVIPLARHEGDHLRMIRNHDFRLVKLETLIQSYRPKE